jgi:hypothetical protein
MSGLSPRVFGILATIALALAVCFYCLSAGPLDAGITRVSALPVQV